MKEIFIQERTLPEAYHKALLALEDAPVIPCPDWNTEQKEVSMTYVVTEPLAEPMISRLFFGDPRSLEQYRQEMLDGIMDFEIERGNWAYTYHARYAYQIPFLINELKRDPWSRRAVLDIRAPEDMESDGNLTNMTQEAVDERIKDFETAEETREADRKEAEAQIEADIREAEAKGLVVPEVVEE